MILSQLNFAHQVEGAWVIAGRCVGHKEVAVLCELMSHTTAMWDWSDETSTVQKTGAQIKRFETPPQSAYVEFEVIEDVYAEG